MWGVARASAQLVWSPRCRLRGEKRGTKRNLGSTDNGVTHCSPSKAGVEGGGDVDEKTDGMVTLIYSRDSRTAADMSSVSVAWSLRAMASGDGLEVRRV